MKGVLAGVTIQPIATYGRGVKNGDILAFSEQIQNAFRWFIHETDDFRHVWQDVYRQYRLQIKAEWRTQSYFKPEGGRRNWQKKAPSSSYQDKPILVGGTGFPNNLYAAWTTLNGQFSQAHITPRQLQARTGGLEYIAVHRGSTTQAAPDAFFNTGAVVGPTRPYGFIGRTLQKNILTIFAREIQKQLDGK